MTPQEFVDSLDPAETLRRFVIIHHLPLYNVAQWLGIVRDRACLKYDTWRYQINPIRLHGFIDGIAEPRLSVVTFDARDPFAKPPRPEDDPGAIFISGLTL